MLDKLKKFVFGNYSDDDGDEEEQKKKNKAMGITCLVIFIVIVLVVRLGANDTPSNNSNKTDNNTNNETVVEKEEEKDPVEESEELEIGYSYIYTINTDTTKEVITGTRYNDKEKLTIINSEGTKSYAKLSSNFLEKGEDGEYHLISDPSPYFKYCEVSDIIDMLEGITPIDGVYYVPISTIIRFINGTNIGDSELKDTIKIESKNNTISGMELDFSNSINNTSLGNIKKLQIKIEYSDVGETKDFNLEVE